MRRRKTKITFTALFLFLLTVLSPLSNTTGQPQKPESKDEPKDDSKVAASVELSGTKVSVKFQSPDDPNATPVTIPITARWKESKDNVEEVMPLGELTVKEDGEEQTILSIRSIGNSPIYLAVLIQDDLVNSINNEIKGIAGFIEKLPKGSRVMIAYIHSGSLQVRQKFTNETDKAIKALRIPLGSALVAPYNPYIQIVEGLKRYDSQPSGRRALLVISDGVDLSQGASSPSQNLYLDRAISEAQRRSVAIYSIFAPTVSASQNSFLTLTGQGFLERLSEETGGYAYIRGGTSAPLSFDPFLKELGVSLYRQIALTYLSTHPKKGYHKIQVISNQSNIKIDHPAGYTKK